MSKGILVLMIGAIVAVVGAIFVIILMSRSRQKAARAKHRSASSSPAAPVLGGLPADDPDKWNIR